MSFRRNHFKLLTGTAELPLLVACGSGSGSSSAGGDDLTVNVSEAGKDASFGIDNNRPSGAPSGPIPLLIGLAGFGAITLDSQETHDVESAHIDSDGMARLSIYRRFSRRVNHLMGFHLQASARNVAVRCAASTSASTSASTPHCRDKEKSLDFQLTSV
ncbi:hypothetical protein WMF04_14930 [Sorangium sp. So ce260]|uniref:hypothetical protein n=1 Tax=Sorangium sp. So ce260 TaxID=3133291 RepID=UPI003F5E10EB